MIAVSALVITTVLRALAPGDGERGPELLEIEAIEAELKRGLQELRLEGSPGAHFAEVRLVRADLLALDGSYGGIITDVDQVQSSGSIAVRVGTPERDNTGYIGAESGTATVEVAIEPAPQLTRKKVWLAMDEAFRRASTAYRGKQTVLDRLVSDVAVPDQAPGPAAGRRLGPTRGRDFVDRSALARMVADLSRRFEAHPKVDNGDVHLQVLRSEETLVTGDSVIARWVRDRAVLAAVADTKADDGMHLDHGRAIHLQALPVADDELRRTGEALIDRVLRELEVLAAAPVLEEDYDGPILFEPEAAAQLLAATVVPHASGVPAPLSDGGRMLELEPAWQSRLGKAVMPGFVDLIDDPKAVGFGRYELDAEGTTAERVVLVQGGRLTGLLMSRTPNAHIRRSNGHARMTPSLGVGPAPSNLTLTNRRGGLGHDGLVRELLKRARDDGYEFAYVVESLRDATVLGAVPRETADMTADSRKMSLPLPAWVVRVDAAGRRTVVRGAILAPAAIRVLRRIRATGRKPSVIPLRLPPGRYGGFGAELGMDGVLAHTVDVQVTTPALLVDGLELVEERGEYERPPTLVHPLRRESATP